MDAKEEARRQAIRDRLHDLRENLKDLGPKYEKAKALPPITGRMKELLDLIVQFNADGNGPTQAIYILGQAAVLAADIREAEHIVRRYERGEANAERYASTLKQAEAQDIPVDDLYLTLHGKPLT